MTTFFCNTGNKPRSPKARTIDFYLDLIAEKGFEFDRLEAFSTAGDIRPPYPYQWLAKVKVREGDDDAIDGVGGTPLEALRHLYKNIKAILALPTEED